MHQSADATTTRLYVHEKTRSLFRKNEHRMEGRQFGYSVREQVVENETFRLEPESGLRCDELAGSIPGVRLFQLRYDIETKIYTKSGKQW